MRAMILISGVSVMNLYSKLSTLIFVIALSKLDLLYRPNWALEAGSSLHAGEVSPHRDCTGNCGGCYWWFITCDHVAMLSI